MCARDETARVIYLVFVFRRRKIGHSTIVRERPRRSQQRRSLLGMAAVNGEAVCQAAREGNIDTVRAYLEAGGDANLSNPGTGRTLLHNACRQVIVRIFNDSSVV